MGIMNPAEDSAIIAEIGKAREDSNASRDLVMGLGPVADARGQEQASALIVELRRQAVILGGRRDAILGPLREVEAQVRALFTPAIEALGDAEDELKRRVASFRADARDARTAALAIAPQHPEALALAEEARLGIAGPTPGLRFRRQAQGEVLDLDALPAEYVIRLPDMPALRHATMQADGDPGIPGWRGRIVEAIAVHAGEPPVTR